MDWQDKFKELGFPIDANYTPEPPDIDLYKKCVSYVKSKFPNELSIT